ncbi:MAG TPA: condensation domain-containing protein [Longimicrobium sp.]|nr:condensation domain-containing protein [Longimicrobium sp.]
MSDVQDRIAGLSQAKRALLERLRVAGVRPADAIPRRGEGPAPLSWEQRRLWFIHRLAPEGGAYTIPVALRLSDALDGHALRAAIRGVVERHQALRLIFREVDGEPVQEAGPADRVPIDTGDLRMRPGDVDAALADFFARGFHLEREPPFRALLLRTGEDEHVLALAMHHIASDGASTPVLLREMEALYAARVEGRDAHLPDPPLQFPDFAAWQRGRPVDAGALHWWRDALAGAPHVLEVPADRPRPAAQSFAGSRVAFALGGALSERVRALAAGEQASVFSVLVAALAVVLHRATGEDDLLIGSAVANREAPGAEAAVGFFTNTVPLRVRVDADASARALIAAARRTVAEAQDHAGIPFDRLVDAAEVRRDPGRTPLVQVVVSLDPAEEDGVALPGVRTVRLPVDTGAAAYAASCSIQPPCTTRRRSSGWRTGSRRRWRRSWSVRHRPSSTSRWVRWMRSARGRRGGAARTRGRTAASTGCSRRRPAPRRRRWRWRGRTRRCRTRRWTGARTASPTTSSAWGSVRRPASAC